MQKSSSFSIDLHIKNGNQECRVEANWAFSLLLSSPIKCLCHQSWLFHIAIILRQSTFIKIEFHSSVKEVECYGSWKEGSTFYFLGMLNDSHIRGDNYEGRFRCFAYQKIFNGYKLSQSGDARCDIWSPDEGYITMKINKGTRGYLAKTLPLEEMFCNFCFLVA